MWVLCGVLLLGLPGLLHRFEALLLDAFLLGLFGGADGVGFLERGLDVQNVSMVGSRVTCNTCGREAMRERGQG